MLSCFPVFSEGTEGLMVKHYWEFTGWTVKPVPISPPRCTLKMPLQLWEFLVYGFCNPCLWLVFVISKEWLGTDIFLRCGFHCLQHKWKMYLRFTVTTPSVLSWLCVCWLYDPDAVGVRSPQSCSGTAVFTQCVYLLYFMPMYHLNFDHSL